MLQNLHHTQTDTSSQLLFLKRTNHAYSKHRF
jgi:hypothetical protein